ncbi:MAG: hypothetical protein N2508_12155 [Anaerolineae bacterium]|nr:hypothetical protein [Anaerolineae bacterium]
MGGVTAEEVLQSIEFELLQGAVSHDDLGAGIQTAREYQNRVRAELLELAHGVPGSRELVIRLFQINEMLLTLVQELNAALHALQVEMRKMARVVQVRAKYESTVTDATGESVSFEVPSFPPMAIPSSDVQRAMRSDALHIAFDVRSVAVPIVGGWIRRLKFALHNLVMFYLRQLAQKQAAVNRTYGEWIMYLIETSERQQIQIDLLRAQVASLQARLGEADGAHQV